MYEVLSAILDQQLEDQEAAREQLDADVLADIKSGNYIPDYNNKQLTLSLTRLRRAGKIYNDGGRKFPVWRAL